MGTRQRRIDRGAERGRRLVIEIGRELRIARRDRGLSLRTVGAAIGCSASELSRIERGLISGVGLELLARIAAAVGLDLAARCYPGGSPLREQGHHDEISAFRAELHPLLGFRTEVRVAGSGDQRTWDGMVEGVRWRTGVECEMSPNDWQALERRLELKQRDGHVDFVILLLPDTRHVRELLRATQAEGSSRFPVPGRTILARLRAGQPPGGNGIVVLRRRAEGVARGAPTDTTVRETRPAVAASVTSNAGVLDVPPDATVGPETERVVTVGARDATRDAATPNGAAPDAATPNAAAPARATPAAAAPNAAAPDAATPDAATPNAAALARATPSGATSARATANGTTSAGAGARRGPAGEGGAR